MSRYLRKIIIYVCDPLNHRIAKVIDGEREGYYLYQGLNINAILAADGEVLYRFTNGLHVDAQLGLEYDHDGDGLLERYYYLKDHLGSVIYLTDSVGTILQRYRYDVFGDLKAQQDPYFDQPFSYTGREYDKESGLLYYRARYYSVEIGRFSQEDSETVWNRYYYVKNEPLIYSDPHGKFEQLVEIGASCAVGAAEAITDAQMPPEACTLVGLVAQVACNSITKAIIAEIETETDIAQEVAIDKAAVNDIMQNVSPDSPLFIPPEAIYGGISESGSADE